MVYERALACLRTRLQEEGLIDEFDVHLDVPFWGSSALREGIEGTAVPVFEATYVDDEAMYLTAKTPAELDRRIAKFLPILVSTFKDFGLKIN